MGSNPIRAAIFIMSHSNTILRKQEQLGLSFATASYRLYKKVLFQLAKEANRDTCFRCNCKITNSEDLTIDHNL